MTYLTLQSPAPHQVQRTRHAMHEGLTLRLVRVITDTMENHEVLNIVCVCIPASVMRYANRTFCAPFVQYCHLWPVWFDHISPHCLTNGTNFEVEGRGRGRELHNVCLDYLLHFCPKHISF